MAENNKSVLFEETKKRLQQIYEFTVMPYNGNVDEAGDDQENQDNGQEMPQDGGMGEANGEQMPPQGQDGFGADAQQQNPMGAQDPMGGIGGADQAPQGPEGFAPQDAQQDPMMGGGDITNQDFEGGEQPSPDDDVVDISDLTDSQEKTEEDVTELNDKFSKVLNALDSFKGLIQQNDAKIDDLRAEFEKRNPTQIEKLSMQTAKSGPFNVKPEDYWKEKEATSNYSTESDNNGKNMGQYVITKDDVNGNVDWKSIADSMDDDDFMYNQTLDGVLKY